MKIRTIVNPVAGKGKSREIISEVRKRLEAAVDEVDLVQTSRPGDGYRLSKEAAREDFDRVVAVGGDGTVREVASGLVGTGIKLAIIPSGMGNDLARSLGIPSDVKKASSLVSAENFRRIDLGQVEEQYFSVLGLGFPVEVMELVNRGGNNILPGPGYFLVSIMRVVFRMKPFGVGLEVDGDGYKGKALAVFVMNPPYTGGGLELSPGARMDDGLLDVVVIGDAGKRELLGQLPRVYRGEHLDHPKVHLFRGKSVRIEAEEELRVELDGDLLAYTPVSAEVVPNALGVVVPDSSRE